MSLRFADLCNIYSNAFLHANWDCEWGEWLFIVKRICCLLISEEKKRKKKVNAFLYILNASLFYHLSRAAFRCPFVAKEI